MKKLLHAMDRATLDAFIQSKRELIAVAATMTSAERQAARAEIMEAATIHDVPEDMQSARELYRVENGCAIIPISGKLVESPDICDGFFSDCTTYGFISAATKAADEDPAVRKIVFQMSTGGGAVSGLDKCAQAIAACKKPTVARVSGICASAGYWLASQMDKICATSPTDFIGSIGVAMELVDYSKQDAMYGVTRHVLTSTDAPDKRPDIRTEEGRSKYVEELDALHEVFVARVAAGRGVPPDVVNKDFGRGGLLIASKALAVGMIDEDEEEEAKTPAPAGQTEEVLSMDLKEFLAQNPAAKAEFDAAIAAASEGERNVLARVDKASKFLLSDAYPETVKKTAVAMLKGEQTEAGFDAVVAAVDAVREAQKLDAAKKETAGQPETPGQQQETHEPGSVISTQADLDAAIARAKANGGN